MKTTNNVQKAILKSTVVVISFVLTGITVNAQNFEKTILENNSFNEIALAMVDNNVETSSASADANAFTAFLEIETEGVLELEDWMTNDSWFDAYTMYLKVDSDESLELENWMIDDSKFGIPTFQIIEEDESELELEDWMLNEDLFNTNNEKEQALELEEWMTSDKIWVS